jgi:hypothetical protein
MTSKKPVKKTAKKAVKKVAKKAPAKKAAAKKAPAKKAISVNSATETNIIKPIEPNNSGAVVYASEVKNPSLRERMFNWFRN